jgi:Ca-activated chloride channel family protein
MTFENDDIIPSEGLHSQDGPIPLLAVSVHAELRDGSARTTIAQRYRNVENEPVETVYVFPIDERAAVCGFEAIVDGKRIVAESRERDAAFEAYDRGMADGHGAYLLDQARPDVFVASIGNLMPGSEVELSIQLLSELTSEDAADRYVLPTTVAPRYAPAVDQAGLGETPEQLLNPPSRGEVAYGLTFEAEIQLSVAVCGVESPTHPIGLRMDGQQARVYLSQEDVALDRDLVLLVRRAEAHAPRVQVERDGAGAATLGVTFAPEFERAQAPCELLFLLDCSGSMGGSSIASAKDALQLCLRSLLPGSYFNVVAFGSDQRECFEASVAYDDHSLAEASEWVDALEADLGGTEILPPLTSLLERPPASSLPRELFVLTDGQVTNTAAVLDLMARHADTTRCFSFGVGYGASHHLVRGLARAGRGAAEFILPQEQASPKVLRQVARALAPAITNVTVDWGDERVSQAPEAVPPVFAGEAMRLYALVEGELPRRVRLNGETAQGPLSFEVDVPDVASVRGEILQTLWARERIRDLEERGADTGGSKQRGRREEKIRKEIIHLAVSYGLCSRETSLVAIELRESPTEEEAELRRVPIALTHGWGEGADATNLLARMPSASPDEDIMFDDADAGLVDELDMDDFGVAEAAPAQRGAIKLGEINFEEILDSERDELGTRKMLDLITLQRADGHWELDAALALMLGVEVRELKRALRELAGTHASELASCWATTLVLVYLETEHSQRFEVWNLVATKARAWLQTVALPTLSLERIRERAEQVIRGGCA